VHSILRIASAGAAVALAVAAIGWGVERQRFGPTDQSALARVRIELRDQIDARADRLRALAGRTVVSAEQLRAAPRDPRAAEALFDRVASVLAAEETGRTGVTVYGADGAPAAWGGRVFDLPRERLDGPASLFVAPGAIGPRLVRIEPVLDRTATSLPRIGTIAVEHSLAAVQEPGAPSDTFVLSTALVPVAVRPHLPGAPPRSGSTIITSTRADGLALEADVSPRLLAEARADWRRNVAAATVGVLAFTLLLCIAPVLELRRRSPDWRTFVTGTLAFAALTVTAFALLLFALRDVTGSAGLSSPAGLFLAALTALALVAAALELIERRRIAPPRPRVAPGSGGPRVLLVHLVAGAAATTVLAAYELALRRIVENTPLDVLHFSLHPIGATRLAVTFALLLLHASAIWLAVAATRALALHARRRRSGSARLVATAAWAAGAAATVAAAAGANLLPAVPMAPLLLAIAAAGACAAAFTGASRRLRRASQAARLGVLFLALVAPALALYPSLFSYATTAKERLVAGTYGPEVISQREDLQRRVQQTIEQIDALPSLAEFVGVSGETPTVDRAFVVWSRTDLAKYRLTSAVELYNVDGQLVSRFALHLPEYTPSRSRATSCSWEDLFDEAARFGSSERHVLRTSRAICEHGRSVGTIVVRVMLDYRTLPFISTESPYLQSLRSEQSPEGVSGRDVEFAIYGWSRAPIMESGKRVWDLSDRAFRRLTDSRAPFWDVLERDGEQFRAYFLSDRGAIYVLGYPIITPPGHVINLAELALLTAVLYVSLLIAVTVVGTAIGRSGSTGRQLLREVRSSFYRKLFLAYVAGAVVPVVILAFAIRTYFVAQLTAGAEEAAQATVTTAQRLVEDYAAIQQAGSPAIATLDDQIMVLVWRAIDEDVNLFERGRLQATSARDLFASALLSTRTPGDVYKSILLEREPTFIGDEKIGEVPYRLAAAPVRAGGREGIVTVPLTNRQNDIEAQIDELDRRVRAAAVLFILLGAAIGYWMAERIADPVSRLTRATRRIARGDLDARIAATSSDELRRLVEDFNQMAADLQRQRVELERTQRLEAWADMARQVAHDIKNPLTPIQLSAEHARRINIDQGRPLSPVLDDCVNAILAQVRLLRQISAEFSSFASSPKPRPEPTDVAALVEEVVSPYRLGLGGRIEIETAAPREGAGANIDRTLFSRALTNVIENALHAMPGTGRLTVTTTASPDQVIVEVADTGVGMDAEALAKIFEPYFSTKATGTGLGLTIAKRNVELNGGRIDVRSQRGVGTVVTLIVPAYFPSTENASSTLPLIPPH
jgi:signal transduction histidine kinase